MNTNKQPPEPGFLNGNVLSPEVARGKAGAKRSLSQAESVFIWVHLWLF